MCEICDKLDKQIEKYKQLRLGFSDRRTLEAIQEFMDKLVAQKEKLHPKTK
jgi:hypothetical protein